MSSPEDVTCREVVEIITAYLEGALTPREREAIEMHLAYCQGCLNYLEQMRETIRQTGTLAEESLPPELQEEICRAFADVKRT